MGHNTDRHCLRGTILIDIVYGARKQTFYDGDPEWGCKLAWNHGQSADVSLCWLHMVVLSVLMPQKDLLLQTSTLQGTAMLPYSLPIKTPPPPPKKRVGSWLFCYLFFFEWRSAHTHQTHFLRQGSVHSGSVSWDDCGRMFPHKLHVSCFRIGSPIMLGQRYSQPTPTSLDKGCMPN